MARRATSSEPAFGSDSFLDVTANLVGVLIILIVLVGLRVAKAPPRPAAVDVEIERRLAAAKSDLTALNLERLDLERQLNSIQQGLSAKEAALIGFRAGAPQQAAVVQAVASDLLTERQQMNAQQSDLLVAQSRLVSLGNELERAKAGVPAARQLDHRSPVSQRVESEEIHLELEANRVSFIDLANLMERAKGKWRSLENELRTRGRATSEVGPAGPFRLKFTVSREDVPFSQSLLYGNGSFRARLAEWQVIPTQDPHGELLDAATAPSSQLDSVLARHSPNKYAVTIWTYSDSFTAFRQLRDHLTERGYTVVARPLPVGVPIRGSVYGSRSFSQ